ncbi:MULTISPECIES: DUF262 domain-containing protein [Cobetia]|uniref:DUF262 domain-containing protein n=1 Tax=Cobetia TaxID=204286 RepID=UPI0009872E01|nr:MULTISPECIES: DUF262 domain-containing protein [Cobetia]POR04954.1 hypothetical protein BOH68_14900 [Cobetia sp. MM1IDA2H-1]
MKTFSFDDIGIAKIFSDYSLNIPAHQRDYAWTDEEVEQLFSDLEAAYRNSSEYFLGTIVAIEKTSSSDLNVVDGQQRLTTTYLLLTAIRDHLEAYNIGSDISTSLQNSYLFKSDRREGFKQRLSLNTDDRDYFKELTAQKRGDKWPPEPNRTSHRLLKNAYFKAKERVEGIAKSIAGVDAQDTFNSWIDYLENQAQVILLRAHDEGRAFKMFETLNDRGLRTSQADLVKSYLFGQSKTQIDIAQTKWSNMLENLQELGDDDPQVSFLRHHLIAFSGFVRMDGVYESIQSKYKNENSSITFLGSLSNNSRAYVATFNSDNDYWDSYSKVSRKYLSDFNMFDLKPMRPLLLAIAVNFNKKEFELAIKFLTSLSVRLVLTARTRSGVNEQAFADSAINISNKVILTSGDLIEALQKIVVSDKEFEEVFSVCRVSKTYLARYYLRELEHTSNTQREELEWVNDDVDDITLEHILPKSKKKDCWVNFSEEEHLENKNRLGNQCLLKKSRNNSMSNDSFEIKRKVFSESSISTTSAIAQYESWSPETINNRQLEMAKIALAAWPINKTCYTRK